MNTRDFLLEIEPDEIIDSNTIESRFLKSAEAERTVSALNSVINYIITDAFNLTAEESVWIGVLISEALEPLKTIIPSATFGAVRQELNTGEYTRRLFERTNTPEIFSISTIQYDESVKYATASDWAEGICEIILVSYPRLRPMLESRIIGSIYGIFRELGVSDDLSKSRPSLYLPTNIRFLLRSKAQATS